MTDRYLFRGKRADNGEWVVGYYVKAEKLDKTGVEYLIIEKSADGSSHLIIPKTVGQCTGLKDDNGKLMFEGDILKLGTGKTRFVFYGVSGFRHAAYNGYAKEFDFKDKGYQVIGNIHDNPELLEVKE